MHHTSERALRLEFTASGSEYFRIWVVNLLLIVVTLGLYLPFAKARRLRYFYANTLVDGQPLAFHGDPWRMFFGFMLMVLLFGAYATSGHFSGWVALAAFMMLALLWPALWRSSLRFRLGNTSWRGLRFSFAGTSSQAYRAMLPLFLPGLIMVAANAWAFDGIDVSDPKAREAALRAQLPWVFAGLGLLLAIAPWGLSQIKRYQHGGYRFAQQQASLALGARPFYVLALKLFGLLVAGVVLAMAVPFLAALAKPGRDFLVPILGLFFLALVLLLIWLQAANTAGLQNICWRATRSESLRFDSQLDTARFIQLQTKNLLLIVLTLGLYRPFAAVNTFKCRLDAMQVFAPETFDAWQAGDAMAPRSATGEMSGDFFGFDLGL